MPKNDFPKISIDIGVYVIFVLATIVISVVVCVVAIVASFFYNNNFIEDNV